MPYTRTTFAAFRTQLAGRLDDPNKVFFPDAELKQYTYEALRFWNALTGEARQWYPLAVSNPAPVGQYVPASVWYDLFDGVQNPTSPLIASLTDFSVYSWMQYKLLEPTSVGALTLGTGMWEVNDWVQAVQNKRDEYLLSTSCTQFVRSLNVTPNQNGVVLPETVIQARRAYWLPAVGGNPTPLLRTDERQLAGYGADVLASSGDPFAFSAGVELPLTVSLYGAPNQPGLVELITQESQGLLNSATGTALYMPNDLVPGVMWGAISHLLTFCMEAKDDARAQYAMSRFQQFVELGRNYPFVMAARIGNVALLVDAVESLDAYNPGWRTAVVNGAPVQQDVVLGISGRNLVAFPTPGAQQVNLYVVTPAPLPVNDTDAMQVGDEVLEAILDYAHHTAVFKQGAQEVQDTMPLFSNCVRIAAERNAKVRAMASFRDVLYGTAAREEQLTPGEVAGSEDNQSQNGMTGADSAS